MANSSQPNSPSQNSRFRPLSLNGKGHWLRLVAALVSSIANLVAPSNILAKGYRDDANVLLFTPIPNVGVSQGQIKAPSLLEAQLSYAGATGQVRFARLSPGQSTQIASSLAPTALKFTGGTATQRMAQAFIQQYGSVFGVSNAAEQLLMVNEVTDTLKQTHLNYRQVYRGVPVLGGELKLHFNAAGEVQSVNGLILPNLALNPTPTLDTSAATLAAFREVRQRPPQPHDHTPAHASSDAPKAEDAAAQPLPEGVSLQARHVTLYVYHTGLAADQPGTIHLVYEVEVVATDTIALREFVYVDAHTGKIIDRQSAINDVLHREVYEPSYMPANRLWHDGDAFPFSGSTATQTLNVNNIISGTGYAYHFFNNAFGRDSYDGAGDFMRSVNNDPTIYCPNANWNGVTTNYCDGVTSDDIVAHEWAHAYTERTHGLIYSYQPGALNEAYSDIWGEVIDRLNGFGIDTPDIARSENICTDSNRPQLKISAPAAISANYSGRAATFGPALTASGITGSIRLAEPIDACAALTNTATISGHVALVDRGTCGFTVKVKNAQDAGATAVVVADNVPGLAGMTGTDATIVIPSIRVEKTTGDLIKAQIALSEVVTGTLFGAIATNRWLMGEDSTAIGGAIRDMYAPTCYDHPGKVSDAQYVCTAGDGGGVHSNSGVPNHAFALTVDGGNYNGQSITGIGLTKASHIYWRAQTIYQTPFTDFADHADALEQACVDLTGQPLMGLSTSQTSAGISGEMISAADCQQLSKALTAVEMRSEPAQCNFQPLLAKNTPALCTVGNYPAMIYADGLESNPATTWSVTTTMLDLSTPIAPIMWQWASNLPAHRSGSAFFANNNVDNVFGCFPGSDVARQMLLLSPAITLTAGISHVLTFNHYMASEDKYDGGVVLVKVNGGPLTMIDRTHFKFNSYNALVDPVNPLGNIYAFTGLDQGRVVGSWGQSQVDVSAYATTGDVVQLGWMFAADGCGGAIGWYIDDPQISYCAAPNQIELALSNNHPYVGEVVTVTATVRDSNATPLSGVALTSVVSPTVLGTLNPFTTTNLAGQTVSTFTAGITNSVGSIAVGDGSITSTAALTVSLQGNCLATPNNGTTLFETLDASAVQLAVNVANPGNTVKIAGYCAGVQSVAGLSQTVYISAPLLLQGGYTRGNWLTSNPINNPTILDAQQQGRVVYGTTTLALSNLNLTNGKISGNGGGVYGPRVTLQAVTLTQNTATGFGGALYATGIVAVVNGHVYSNSAGSSGGAIYSTEDVSVRSTHLISNAAGISGGAIEMVRTLTATSSSFDLNLALTEGGGAIHLNDPSALARLVITGSTFMSNTALQGYGGAIDVDTASTVSMTNSSFNANVARDGGALDNDSVFATLVQSSVFTNNHATEFEGGALWVDGPLTVVASTFTGNYSALTGGALANWGDAMVISQSKFIGNRATNGGGIVYAGDSGQIMNNLFANNVATGTLGEALYLDPTGAVSVQHNTIVSATLANGSAIYLANGSAGITNTLVTSHSIGISQTSEVSAVMESMLFDEVTVSHTKETGGSGVALFSNLWVGPANFVNAAAGDYHLGNTSMAIDLGVATSVSQDFEGQARPQQGGPDIGMDESPYSPVTDLSVSQTTSTGSLMPGQAITYSIVVSNLGPQWVRNIGINDVAWPAQLVNVLSSTSAGVTVLGNAAWQIAELAAGAQAMLTITAKLDPAISAAQASFPLTHTVTVSHAADSDAGNNSSTAVVVATLPQVSLSNASVSEGDVGSKNLIFTATLSPANPYASGTVNYATQDGSATTGSDYTANSGTLTFAVGQTTQPITVVISGDTSVESDETLTLTLSNGTGVLITGVGSASGQIVNDDNVVPIDGLSASTDAPTALGDATTFTASVLSGSDITYAWDFGDGNNASGANAVHVYGSAGVFTATVTASNGAGSASASIPVTVTSTVLPPVAPSGLSIVGPRSGKVGQQLTFTGTLLVGTEVSFAWLVTPTTALDNQLNAPEASSTVFNHTFANAGSYTVTVRASNASGVLDYSIPVVISVGMTPRVYLPITMG